MCFVFYSSKKTLSNNFSKTNLIGLINIEKYKYTRNKCAHCKSMDSKTIHLS